MRAKHQVPVAFVRSKIRPSRSESEALNLERLPVPSPEVRAGYRKADSCFVALLRAGGVCRSVRGRVGVAVIGQCLVMTARLKIWIAVVSAGIFAVAVAMAVVAAVHSSTDAAPDTTITSTVAQCRRSRYSLAGRSRNSLLGSGVCSSRWRCWVVVVALR